MAKKKVKKKSAIDRTIVARVVTILVTISVAAGIVVTGLFVNDVLNQMSGESFKLSEQDAEAIEKIDLDTLSDLIENIEDKNKLDAARAGRLRNPFAPPEPEPLPEPAEPEEE